MQKLIILSLVLLSTLSATLLTEIHSTTKEPLKPGVENVLEKDNARLNKLKRFDVKNYYNTYEENESEQNIRIRRIEYLKNKERK